MEHSLDPDALLARTDELYREACASKYPYTAPELLPNGIRSNQVRALIVAICEAIADEFNEAEEPRADL